MFSQHRRRDQGDQVRPILRSTARTRAGLPRSLARQAGGNSTPGNGAGRSDPRGTCSPSTITRRSPAESGIRQAKHGAGGKPGAVPGDLGDLRTTPTRATNTGRAAPGRSDADTSSRRGNRNRSRHEGLRRDEGLRQRAEQLGRIRRTVHAAECTDVSSVRDREVGKADGKQGLRRDGHIRGDASSDLALRGTDWPDRLEEPAGNGHGAGRGW